MHWNQCWFNTGDDCRPTIPSVGYSSLFKRQFIGFGASSHHQNVSCYQVYYKTAYICLHMSTPSFGNAYPLFMLIYQIRTNILSVSDHNFIGNLFPLPVAEFVGPRYRVPASIVFNTLFTVGSLILSIISFFVRDAIYIQIIIAIPSVLTITFWW